MTPTATNFPMGVHPNSSEATASSGSSVVGLEVSSGAQNPIRLFILRQPSKLITHTRGFSVEAPGTRSVAWVAKENKVILELDCLCPSIVPSPRGRRIRPTSR